MDTAIRNMMRNVKLELPGKLSRSFQCGGLPEYIVNGLIFSGPFIRYRHIVEVQVRYRIQLEAGFDGFLVALCDQNMDFDAASGEVSRPIPTEARLTTGIRSASIGRK